MDLGQDRLGEVLYPSSLAAETLAQATMLDAETA
jgi:hypothetical protein